MLNKSKQTLHDDMRLTEDCLRGLIFEIIHAHFALKNGWINWPIHSPSSAETKTICLEEKKDEQR